MNQKNVVVAFGGVSPEHEVSVLTAMQALAVLKESSYRPLPLYISKSGRFLTGDVLLELEQYEDLKKLEREATPCTFTQSDSGAAMLSQTDTGRWFFKPKQYLIYAVFTAFHGGDGENGAFQGLCEQFNIPYTGSGILASSVGMDKVTAKQLCKSNNIPVVEGVDFFEQDWVNNKKNILKQAQALSYPLIVKPVSLGSSIGVVRVQDEESLKQAVEEGFRYDNHMLIEKAVHPLMEINCSVLGSPENCQASVCERPLGKEETLSFEDKYQNEGTDKGMASADRVIPADIPDELTGQIQDLSLNIFKLFNASGVARLDFLVHAESNRVFFNEINTIPGSFSFYLWEKSEISFEQLVFQLIDIAVEQHRQKNGRVRSYDTNLLSEKAVTGIKGLKGTKN